MQIQTCQWEYINSLKNKEMAFITVKIQIKSLIFPSDSNENRLKIKPSLCSQILFYSHSVSVAKYSVWQPRRRDKGKQHASWVIQTRIYKLIIIINQCIVMNHDYKSNVFMLSLASFFFFSFLKKLKMWRITFVWRFRERKR